MIKNRRGGFEAPIGVVIVVVIGILIVLLAFLVAAKIGAWGDAALAMFG